MQKVTLRKVSVLGLVLLAASAVTAAIVPAKKNTKAADACNGNILTTVSGVNRDHTCKPGPDLNNCITTATVSTANNSATGIGGDPETTTAGCAA